MSFLSSARIAARRLRRALPGAGFSLCAVAATWLPPAYSQSSAATAAAASGTVSGTVRAADGQPVAGATVQVLDTEGRVLGASQSDSGGHYAVHGLLPGRYTLSAGKPGSDTATADVEVQAGAERQTPLTLVAQLAAVTVSARLERARNALSPSTGSSRYSFDQAAIDKLPQGEHTPLNQVLLQAPGVANDSYGQIHVRGDHADLQYRINGVILPEGVATFGQTFDTRFVDTVDLLTGALPAQYGYRTAGVVDITTRKGNTGGEVDLYGGSRSTLNPSAQYGYTRGNFSSFFTGSYLSSTLGLEPPTPGANAIHDRTTQGRGFGYLSYLLGDHLRLSGIFGVAGNRFEIPNNPGQAPDPGYLAELGLPGYDSAALDERQYERNQYGIVALQGLNEGGLNWQLALSQRQSAVEFAPDPLGDLAFNGVAARIKRKSVTYGVQGDASYPIAQDHTLRAGVFANLENDRADNSSLVFPTAPNNDDGSCPAGTTPGGGQCLSGGPQTIVDNNPKNGNTLYGVYLQDQWDLSKSFTLNYGLRFDLLHAFVTASQLSPRLGAVWRASRHTSFHAGYARYFTPPANELITSSSIARFDNTTNAFEVQKNSPVQPERQHYFDLGVVEQLLPGLSLGLDGYYKYIREVQDEGQFGQALIFAPFNYQQGHVYGLELSGSYHRGPLSAYLNVARSRAQATRLSSGEFNFGPADLAYIGSHYIYLDHDQSLTVSGGASYDWSGTTLGFAATYGSGLRKDAVDADGNTLIPNGAKLRPNMQLDLSASRNVHLSEGFGDIELRVAAINVFDRVNIIHDGSGIGIGAAQYGPRAALYFGLSKPFGQS
jgi:outer membrane receptor protein involved in Fe transport